VIVSSESMFDVHFVVDSWITGRMSYSPIETCAVYRT